MQSAKMQWFDSLMISCLFGIGCMFLNWQQLNQRWSSEDVTPLSFEHLKILTGFDQPILARLFSTPPEENSFQKMVLPQSERVILGESFFHFLESTQWIKTLRSIELQSDAIPKTIATPKAALFSYQPTTQSYMFKVREQAALIHAFTETIEAKTDSEFDSPNNQEIAIVTTRHQRPTIFSSTIFEKLREAGFQREKQKEKLVIPQEDRAIVNVEPKRKKIAHDQNLRDLNSLIQSGKIAFAGEQLKRYIAMYPSVSAYQLLLGEMYLTLKQFDDLYALVTPHIESDDTPTDFVALLARAYIEKNQLDQALTLLTSYDQPLLKVPALYALQANIYQRLQQHEKAAEIYEQLVSSFPKQSKWWLGFGLSLESMKENQKALSAYESALQDNQLPKSLQDYAKERINYLKHKIQAS